ncbi:MAG: metallophosphoesterase, partial [Myxococcota bacterium]|nr:metallophosphoesterase [Myxococcota bacterium]
MRSAVTIAGIVLAIALGPQVASAGTVRGLVFDDTNGDGLLSAGERGVADAVVAYDVLAFATTDAAGQFELAIPKPASNIVWVRVPEGFVPGPVWKRIVADETIELPLRRLAEPVHGPLTFVVTADTHLDAAQPFATDLRDVARAATALDSPPAFFTILGDITQSNKDHQFDLVEASLVGLGVPYIPVPGNHDWYDGGEAWFRRYGPDNYSFDLGGVHFVVWNMSLPEEAITQYLGAELARVDPAMPIVALTHAPPVPPILDALRRLGVDYVLTGHTHTNRAVDHGGLIELTTEPLLMGGLDFTPAGYRVVTLDGGVLSSYHRTVVDEPLLAMIAPAHGGCLAPGGGPLIVAAELDAGGASVTARVDCGTPIALRYAGSWSWRTELPALASGSHTIAIDARAPSGTRVSRTFTVEVCARPVAASAPAPAGTSWPQLGGNARHTGATPVAIAPPLGQRWASTVGGHVLAAPVVAGGLVFVTATDLGDGRTGGVAAIDLATGAMRWRVATPSP